MNNIVRDMDGVDAMAKETRKEDEQDQANDA